MIELSEVDVLHRATANVQAVMSEILGGHPEEYPESLHLVRDLAMDSLELLDLAMVLEERYGIVLESDDIFKLNTIGDVAVLIVSNYGKRD
ncbi:acyl carrier protein [Burkholderia ubonensis]|uniref:acyl carrier protein n=1 Tax=Burkholderia ubonensis TaxID=101571 RepID=UPI0007587BB5|nr:acyl carrier protein [Burkholderia ubonensis]KVC71741.1 hypothetical protein WI75_25510 [Burkholderia ubonensis]